MFQRIRPAGGARDAADLTVPNPGADPVLARVVAVVVDDGVSGATAPEDRPAFPQIASPLYFEAIAPRLAPATGSRRLGGRRPDEDYLEPRAVTIASATFLGASA